MSKTTGNTEACMWVTAVGREEHRTFIGPLVLFEPKGQFLVQGSIDSVTDEYVVTIRLKLLKIPQGSIKSQGGHVSPVSFDRITQELHKAKRLAARIRMQAVESYGGGV